MVEVEGHGDNGMNNDMEVLLAIHDMASAIRETSQHNHEPHDETESDQIMRIQGEFRKTRLSIFKGDLNPMQAEEWLRQIKRKLNDQRVLENLKVIIACTYLEGQAYHSVLVNPDLQITTWTTFEVIFLEKYFPETMRAMKTREFENLCQNEMIVAQYVSKYEELMRFAPYMIPDETTKATKLEEGLRAEIKEKVELFKLKRYDMVVDHALMAE